MRRIPGRAICRQLKPGAPFPCVVAHCHIGSLAAARQHTIVDSRYIARKGKALPADADAQAIGNGRDAQGRRSSSRDSVRLARSISGPCTNRNRDGTIVIADRRRRKAETCAIQAAPRKCGRQYRISCSRRKTADSDTRRNGRQAFRKGRCPRCSYRGRNRKRGDAKRPRETCQKGCTTAHVRESNSYTNRR